MIKCLFESLEIHFPIKMTAALGKVNDYFYPLAPYCDATISYICARPKQKLRVSEKQRLFEWVCNLLIWSVHIEVDIKTNMLFLFSRVNFSIGIRNNFNWIIECCDKRNRYIVCCCCFLFEWFSHWKHEFHGLTTDLPRANDLKEIFMNLGK